MNLRNKELKCFLVESSRFRFVVLGVKKQEVVETRDRQSGRKVTNAPNSHEKQRPHTAQKLAGKVSEFEFAQNN